MFAKLRALRAWARSLPCKKDLLAVRALVEGLSWVDRHDKNRARDRRKVFATIEETKGPSNGHQAKGEIGERKLKAERRDRAVENKRNKE